jgi:hypothetical protein
MHIPVPHQANTTFSAPLKATALKHLHASLFSPATQTWTKAIEAITLPPGHYSLPMEFANTYQNQLPPQQDTLTSSANIRSTKQNTNPSQQRTMMVNDTNPAQKIATTIGFANLIELNKPTNKSYSDLAARFPVHSSCGNLYVLLVQPLKNRSEGKQLQAYNNLLQRIPKYQKLQVHWMDNKASAALKRILVR